MRTLRFFQLRRFWKLERSCHTICNIR
uniref:Uncharacterized protein n=1 Tax=Arundo donax TaxID=35708 RepID=A0A0A9E7L6_ARUDO